MRARRGSGNWSACLGLCALTAAAAFAANAPKSKPGPDLQQIVAWQIALERAGFSPGVIDGKLGPKTLLALHELQRARGLTVTARLDAAAAEALGFPSDEAVHPYTVQQVDADQVTGALTGWLDKSAAKRLGYRDLADELAEKFHCSQALLTALNKPTDIARVKVGETLNVPDVVAGENLRAARLEINLSEKVVRCFGQDGRVVALFHCSIAREVDRRPVGSLKVAAVIHDPEYLFDPDMWADVKGIDRKLVIPPGPRNPVGLCWIALDRPGYGMHGTPTPELIGKTGSHGCFRLANWDALRLGAMVRAGTPVEIGNGAPPAPSTASAPPERKKALATVDTEIMERKTF